MHAITRPVGACHRPDLWKALSTFVALIMIVTVDAVATVIVIVHENANAT
jgi:hypothetical protein